MIRIKYIGTRPRGLAPSTGAPERLMQPGDEFEVDEKTAESLLAQPRWYRQVKHKSRKESADGNA